MLNMPGGNDDTETPQQGSSPGILDLLPKFWDHTRSALVCGGLASESREMEDCEVGKESE